MINFKSGDVVRLKSGGPLMTVEEVDDEHDTVFCTWFKNEKRFSEYFSPVALETPQTPPTPIRT